MNILGQRVQTLVQTKLEVFKQCRGNQNLATKVEWNAEKGGSFLASTGPSWPCLSVSAWLDVEYVSELKKRDKGLLGGLKNLANDLRDLQQPAVPPQNNQPLPPPSRSSSRVSTFFSEIYRIFTSMFYSVLGIFRRD